MVPAANIVIMCALSFFLIGSGHGSGESDTGVLSVSSIVYSSQFAFVSCSSESVNEFSYLNNMFTN